MPSTCARPGSERTGQFLENAFENPLSFPAPKGNENAVPVAECRWKIPPRRSGSNPPEHRFQKQPAVRRRPSRRTPPAGKLVREIVAHSVGRDKPDGVREFASIFLLRISPFRLLLVKNPNSMRRIKPIRQQALEWTARWQRGLPMRESLPDEASLPRSRPIAGKRREFFSCRRIKAAFLPSISNKACALRFASRSGSQGTRRFRR